MFRIKRIVLLLMLFCCITASAQQNQRKFVKVTTRNGASYVGYLQELKSFDYVLLDVREKFLQISFKDMAYIDEMKPASVPSTVAELKSKPKSKSKPVLKLANYRGFLLEGGNNVYLSCMSSPKDVAYDEAAIDVLTRQLRRDGFWHIVENPEEAHFILNCVVNLNDGKASIGISSDLTGGNEYLGTLKGAEDVTEYRKLVWELYNKYIPPLQRKIDKGTISTHLKKSFTAE